MSEQHGELPPGLTGSLIQRAIRLSYTQAMVGAVYGASVGGMFLIGYALMLGADNVKIGLMSTIPMMAAAVQLPAAWMVERGLSRRRITFVASLGNVLGWLLIIAAPYVLAGSGSAVQVNAVIAVLLVVTLFAHVAGNARGSWIGDLIPASYRGSFFGRITMFAGLVGAVFAIVEGRILDVLKAHGIAAFSCLFGFGVLVGLAHAFLFLPQADVPLQQTKKTGFGAHIAASLRNRALMAVLLYAVFWSMQSIAGPFYSTYMIRDLGVSFLGLGLINSVVIAAMLVSAPLWGRAVDRYGCRTVLTLCSTTVALIQGIWPWVDTARAAYWIVTPANIVAGLGHGGVAVALSTILYKVTPGAGRSVQFAVYSIIVTLIVAPMPTVGGHLPGWLEGLVPGADLRATFYASVPFILIAAALARRIPEPNAARTRDLIRAIPPYVRQAALRILPAFTPPGGSGA